MWRRLQRQSNNSENNSWNKVDKKLNLELVPHKNAPLFSSADGLLTLNQISSEILSGNFPTNDIFRETMRQAGLSCLWFFLKCICAYNGPFERLNTTLHVEMANIRQSWLKPGQRGAMFIPRSHYKSTIFTEGGSAWELVRNPELKIRITNSIEDRALSFVATIQDIFQENALFQWLYPEYVPPKRWKNSEIIVPCRKKRSREPSISAGSVSGASEGIHVNLHVVDDMIGLGSLNAGRQSSAEMENARKWFWGSENALLDSPSASRVLVVGTRYAVDDVYDDIIKNSCKVIGHELTDYKPNPRGKWEVYYRKAIEKGLPIFPEEFSTDDFENMAQTDWWTYVTQYLNDPQEAGLAEFSEYSIQPFTMVYRKEQGWFIEYFDVDQRKNILFSLESLDVLQAVDPAATEKYISAKTSRSVVGVIGTSWIGQHFLLSLNADFVSPTKMFDWMFENRRKFSEYLRATYLEANAGFKVLGPIIREREKEKGVYLNLRPGPSFGDKTARIRSALQPVLSERRLFVLECDMQKVEEEQRAFPQSSKKDILDMLTIGVSNSIRPRDPYVEQERQQREQFNLDAISNRTGY